MLGRGVDMGVRDGVATHILTSTTIKGALAGKTLTLTFFLADEEPEFDNFDSLDQTFFLSRTSTFKLLDSPWSRVSSLVLFGFCFQI